MGRPLIERHIGAPLAEVDTLHWVGGGTTSYPSDVASSCLTLAGAIRLKKFWAPT